MFSRGALAAVALAAALAGCGDDSDNDHAGGISPAAIGEELRGQEVAGLGTISRAECSRESGQTECLVLTKDGRGARCAVASASDLDGLHCDRPTDPAETKSCSPEEEKRLKQIAAGETTGQLECVTATVVDKLPAKAEGSVVLGSVLHLPGGEGYGTVAPPRIYLGGVPSGDARKIVWENWGEPVATGTGLTWIYMPEGGYFPERAEIRFRAQNIGHCATRDGRTANRPAYRELLARVPKYPGGPLGRWFKWGSDKSTCGITKY